MTDYEAISIDKVPLSLIKVSNRPIYDTKSHSRPINMFTEEVEMNLSILDI